MENEIRLTAKQTSAVVRIEIPGERAYATVLVTPLEKGVNVDILDRNLMGVATAFAFYGELLDKTGDPND